LRAKGKDAGEHHRLNPMNPGCDGVGRGLVRPSDLPLEKWSGLTERIWLILNPEEGGLDEPEEIHARADHREATGG
jgi:hypothetical protein